MNLPIVSEWISPLPAEEAFARLAALPHVLFLDSAMRHDTLGRYSFIAADPFEMLKLPADGSDGLALLQKKLQPFAATTVADLPPFQGGAAGLLSYDLGRSLERVPLPQHDEFEFPSLAIGLYDIVLAYDHWQRRAWFISHGYSETAPPERANRAQQRIEQLQRILAAPAKVVVKETKKIGSLAPNYPVPGHPGLLSNFSADQYLQAVGRAIEYIHAGDVFQVNLAQRLLYPAESDSLSLYLRLRQRNPATFAAYFDFGEGQIISASPERFLQVKDRRVEARPIKGTRRRTARAEADLFAGDELQESEKDRAENVMIVDLLRNDLSRVCRPESVRATQLCGLETYQYVQHLVSVVEGELEADCTPLDLARAAFPGGSITGAPKVRAMEIISELEPTARGPYCGGIGYLGFDGTLDFNILIRTITASRGWWQFPVGGGIVAQSSPQREYEETWHKAAGLLKALKE
ncbi:aminodeoxychorismate synthase component I [Anatilimnocola floriformis]|uniref:aminodeoxychorismate synthase component I n=1 Tax=Anatilimnocola floriformis TaxID=2948575 RepID=UPI0020C44D11|nr:aminodeoxychorismate synthase component I [Anatilimnocola floriformis]